MLARATFGAPCVVAQDDFLSLPLIGAAAHEPPSRGDREPVGQCLRGYEGSSPSSPHAPRLPLLRRRSGWPFSNTYLNRASRDRAQRRPPSANCVNMPQSAGCPARAAVTELAEVWFPSLSRGSRCARASVRERNVLIVSNPPLQYFCPVVQLKKCQYII